MYTDFREIAKTVTKIKLLGFNVFEGLVEVAMRCRMRTTVGLSNYGHAMSGNRLNEKA